MKILLVDDEKIEQEGIRYLIGRFKFPLIVEEAKAYTSAKMLMPVIRTA